MIATLRRPIAVAIVLLAVVAALAPLPASLVESVYSTGAYATIQRTLTPLSNLTALAWVDAVIGVAVVLFVARWWRVVRPSARATRGREAARAGWWTAVAAALVYLAFLGLWGLNYRRLALIDRLAADKEHVTPVTAARLLENAVEALNRLHGPAHAAPEPAWHVVPPTLASSFASAQARFALARATVPGRPKATLLGTYFRAAGVAGLTNPFGLEVMMTPDALPVERPAILAHEWGHLAGYADEAEASFVGWLVCQSGDELAQYSAWLEILPSRRAQRLNGTTPPPARCPCGGTTRGLSRHRSATAACGARGAHGGVGKLRPVFAGEQG